MEITYRRSLPDRPAETDALVAFLGGHEWPFHSTARVHADQARRWVADGLFDGPRTRTFWITADGRDVGLIRLEDLGDETPVFDLRLAAPHRGRGLGSRALDWLTRYLFDEFPQVNRVEGTTRRDNLAMRRTFLRCGYVKEAHYREAWPAGDGPAHDSVGYAVLRRDWLAGTATPVRWDDEPDLTRPRS
ncbi:GNAT family protein [Kitasatospora sp. NPDC001603]|uniref:GNAT family N-acetyltransferase n=1 Tax=Kitasatospora sp. NPDC001603 TaxID=3154388 RepID=UPI0033291CF4